MNEECEAAPVSGERGRGGRNRSVEECALQEGKADGFIRLKLLAVMKSHVCSLEINIWSKNMEVRKWSGIQAHQGSILCRFCLQWNLGVGSPESIKSLFISSSLCYGLL